MLRHLLIKIGILLLKLKAKKKKKKIQDITRSAKHKIIILSKQIT